MRLVHTLAAVATLLALSATPAASAGVATAVVDTVDGTVCPRENHTDTLACRQLTGRLGTSGAFDLCAERAPHNNFPALALWTAVGTADGAVADATGDAPRPVSGGVCRSVMADAYFVAGEADAYFGLCEPAPNNLLRQVAHQALDAAGAC